MSETTQKGFAALPVGGPKCVYLAPSLLAADYSRLGEQLVEAEKAGVEVAHLDIMDGHFVPNLAMGPGLVKSIRPVTKVLFDVHLMISEPMRYVDAFVDAGADHITVHVESEGDISAVIDRIHELGCSAGITLRPGTPVESLYPFLPKVELALVMTVEPGFGGQSFMASQVPKGAARGGRWRHQGVERCASRCGWCGCPGRWEQHLQQEEQRRRFSGRPACSLLRKLENNIHI